jgi:hypothetical protein
MNHFRFLLYDPILQELMQQSSHKNKIQKVLFAFMIVLLLYLHSN